MLTAVIKAMLQGLAIYGKINLSHENCSWVGTYQAFIMVQRRIDRGYE